MYEVWIDATVLIHKTAKDPGFNLEVKLFRENYTSPDKLIFEVEPSKDGYLTVFVLSDEESGQIYPNALEPQEKLLANKSYSFPKSLALDYEVTSEKPIEINYLVILYTKQEIPFQEDQNSANILRFIAEIAPDQKCINTYSILIKR